jgi:hypothetical protein
MQSAYDLAPTDGDFLFPRGENQCAVFPAGDNGEGEYSSGVGIRSAIEYALVW